MCRPDRQAPTQEDNQLSLYQIEETDKITHKVTRKIAWDTTERSKRIATNTLSRDLQDARWIPHSAETFDKRGTIGGLPVQHHDCVIALSHANVAAKQISFGDIVIL